MQQQELITLLKAHFQDAEISVEIDGSHYGIKIVSEQFVGLRPVQRQQLVYKIIGEKITDGSMHAVHFKLHAP